MARGKYKSAAEARESREGALREAQALAHENERLQRELEAVRQDLNATLESMHGETTRLRNLVIAGTAEEVVELRSTVSELQRRLVDARHEVGLEVAHIYRVHEKDLPLPADPDSLTALFKALGVTPAEFFVDKWANNRRDRRTSADSVKRNWEENVGWGTKERHPVRSPGGMES